MELIRGPPSPTPYPFPLHPAARPARVLANCVEYEALWRHDGTHRPGGERSRGGGGGGGGGGTRGTRDFTRVILSAVIGRRKKKEGREGGRARARAKRGGRKKRTRIFQHISTPGGRKRDKDRDAITCETFLYAGYNTAWYRCA